jgi:desulfoferrodoxin (superoxide reductase-like protein)
MAKLSDAIQSADWNVEKHAPVIECADRVKVDEFFSGVWQSAKDIRVA